MKYIAISILCLIVAASLAADDYSYSQKIKGADSKVSVKVSADKEFRQIYVYDDYFQTENTSKQKLGGGVVEWQLKDKKNNSDIKAVREGNKITISGIFKGKEIKKEHYIDNRPWHQLFTGEIDYFLNSKEKRMEFWALRPENPESAGILVAYKDKEEKLTLNGEEIDAIKVKVTLGGLLSIFWTGDYWYRKSDGLYVKSKPTGDVLVELNK